MNPLEKKSTTPLLTIYYDGACQVCSREIAFYQKAKGHEFLRFVDICRTGFDAIREGLDPVEVHRSFHVRTADGTLYRGVPAFMAIWNSLPGFRWLVTMTKIPGIVPLMNLGYWGFSKIRPYLPRKKFDCDGSPYCEIPKKPLNK
jgi:predicted DCC family thiol-disulfide oxidoreductase YuxK